MCHNNLKFAKQEQNIQRNTSINLAQELTTSRNFINLYHLQDSPDVYIFCILFFFDIRISSSSVDDSPSVSTLVEVNESSIIFTWYIGYCVQKFANSLLSSDRLAICLSTIHLLSIILVLSLSNSCKIATGFLSIFQLSLSKREIMRLLYFSPIGALVS